MNSTADYVGSDACAPCHEKEFRDWKASLHSKMEQAATPETVIGNFSAEGTVLPAEAEGKRIVMIRRAGQYLIEAPDASGVQREFLIERTVGNRYKQRYLTRLPDGSMRTLPVQWFEEEHKFAEWHHRASVAPGSGEFWLDEAWQWQLKCAGCHTTGLDLNYDTSAKRYDTKWRELAIGCESCHGPGRKHVENPRKPDQILCPSDFSNRQQLETCGKCHSRGTAGPEHGAPGGLPGKLAYPYNMLPGADLDQHYVQVTLEKNPKEFWKDNSSQNHHQQLTDHRFSEMYIHGGGSAPHCTTCHEPHRADAMKHPVENNAVCIRCHTEYDSGPELARHSGHGPDPVANPGARCVECHMPRIVSHAGKVKLRSHTYWAPNPKRSRETESPDACLLCHKDKDAAWSQKSFDAIYPPGGTPK